MLEDTPKRMLIDMSEYMSDKNVKRYVRNMLDKIVKIYVRRIVRKNARRYIRQECEKICQKEY